MFWYQLSLWLVGLPVIFLGILGIIFGVNIHSAAEFDDATSVLFIVMGTTLTLIGSGMWFYAGWCLYQDSRK